MVVSSTAEHFIYFLASWGIFEKLRSDGIGFTKNRAPLEPPLFGLQANIGLLSVFGHTTSVLCGELRPKRPLMRLESP